jgi:hypothetical protein
VAGAIRWEDDYRLVYCAFGIESMNSAADRAQLVSRALEWLVPEWPDIEQPQVRLIAPNGGEEFTVGRPAALSWEASDNAGAVTVDLLLSRFGGLAFPETLAVGIANTGSFEWTVTGPAAPYAYIRAAAHDGAGLAQCDASDGHFAIAYSQGLEEAATPFAFRVGPPNPSPGGARVRLALPTAAAVRVSILDAAGREVRCLQEGRLEPGEHAWTWDGGDAGGRRAPGGIYFVRLRGEEGTVPDRAERLLLLR